VPAPARSFIDPPLEKGKVLRLERIFDLGWRHHLVRIARLDAANKFTLRTFAGDDDGNALHILPKGTFRCVEPQLGFSSFLIRPVTLEAIFGKYRQHFAREIHGCRRFCGEGYARKKTHDEHTH